MHKASKHGRITVAIIGTLGAFVLGDQLYAQTPEYPYKRYQDRKEGIVQPRQEVSGEKLVLVSATIESSESAKKENTPNYNLAFYIEDTLQVKVVVREFVNRYKMEPLQQKYLPGVNHFLWPSKIPRFYDIGIRDLFSLAEVLGLGGQRIVPIVLFDTKLKQPEFSYRFCFVPLQSISLLQYKIYLANSPVFIHTGTLNDLEVNKISCILWNGKDKISKIVNDGLYELIIETTFKPPPGAIPRKVISKYQFYHSTDLLVDKQVKVSQ